MTSESCAFIEIDELQMTTYEDILLAIDELLALVDIEERAAATFSS